MNKEIQPLYTYVGLMHGGAMGFLEVKSRTKLQRYRTKKQMEEKLEQFKNIIKRFWMLGTGESKTVIKKLTEVREGLTECKVHRSYAKEYREELTSSSDEENDSSNSHKENENNFFQYIQRTVFISFWITLYVIAIKLQFGIVYIMLSALFGIYYNTRTAPKKRNEISAYSVFNKNCESIDGTLKAEQFEREIRFGAVSVR